MRKRKQKHETQIEFIYGLETEELGGDGKTFVLADKQAALAAAQAWQARTWGEFAQAAGSSLEHFLERWGDEIEELCGKAPTANDTFSFAAYWGDTCFAAIITDPREAAFVAVMESPFLYKVCEEAGFEFHGGFPGCLEVIYFRDEQKVEGLRLAGVNIAKDEALLLNSLPTYRHLYPDDLDYDSSVT